MKARGVTKSEVVVLLVIAAMVAGLLFPCLTKARRSESRETCFNNLKQQAIAVQNYADLFGGKLPTGCLPHRRPTPEQRLSWCVTLLPFLEQDALYRQFKLDGTPTDNDNVMMPVHVLSCPRWDRDKWHTNYFGVSGTGADSATLPTLDPRAGAFGYDREVRLSDIRDGAANTLLIAEQARMNAPWSTGGPATVRPIDTTNRYPSNHSAVSGFGYGPTQSTIQAVMVDGSARSIGSRIDPKVLAAASTIAGSEGNVSFD